MTKAMTKEEVAGNFTAASTPVESTTLASPASLDGGNFLKQIGKGGGQFNSESAPVRSGVDKFFDAPADRASISAKAGMTPLSINPPPGKQV